jgi:hypothetical protein
MNLFEASLRFPTVVFSLGLCVVLVYWLFVLLGALDIDLLGGDADVDMDVDADADLDVAKGGGAAVAGAKGAAGALKGATPDGDHGGHGGHGGIWSGLGLARVPITISVSAIFLVCWLLSLAAMHYAPDVVGTASWVAPTILPVTLLVGLPLAGLVVRPLGGVFALREGKSNRDYVGYTCTVTTGHVDDSFGQATVEDGGTVLVIPVRCDRAGALARNDRALIIDFDTERQAYLVEPAADMLPPARDAEPGETA